MPRVDEIVFPEKGIPIDYPIVNEQFWKHRHTSNIIKTEKVVFIY